ncbi:MAG: DUF3108 domain-containing protein [bacterium]
MKLLIVLFLIFGINLNGHLPKRENNNRRIELTSHKIDSVSFKNNTLKFPSIKNSAFNHGERLVFEVAFGPLVAGTATMSIPDTQTIHGRPCYHMVTTARSTKFVDTFYKVRDRIETFIDMEGLFPWKFSKHLREGSYSTDQHVDYDQINGKIYYKKDTIDAPQFIQGVLSSFYYVRTVPFKVKESFNIDNFGDGKIYPLKILVHKKDRIKVPAGEFDCVIIEPVMREKGVFNRKGRMAIWLTDDKRRIPVLMKSKLPIGSIDARLISFELGGE